MGLARGVQLARLGAAAARASARRIERLPLLPPPAQRRSASPRLLSSAQVDGEERRAFGAAAGSPPGGIKRKSLAHLGGFSYPGPRKLTDIVKLPLLDAHDTAKVKEIWAAYHKHHASAIADSFSAEEFEQLMQRTQRCPLFVVPIPRGGGFFTLITQFQGRQCLVTYLENYKKDPAAAEPYITFTLFDELVARKGVALLRGEVTNQLTRDEGQRVLNALKQFYLGPRKHFESVVAFNEQGSAFDFREVLRAAGLAS